ncbi:YcaO-like family protein [Rugosimonospora acidiphila]|uniref:YcaO-like family protein n=1 Tax=Rugosimonospora acidiphila TaxID=556531 RepID=A0ABP9SFG0_9ACTN
MTHSIAPSPQAPAGMPLGGVAGRVTAEDRAKVVMPGTDRARPVEVSLANALRCAKLVGVTRLADVTHLDTVGIPTYQAIRPTSRTLTVSQGKGLSDALASVSALMESTELWHAENAVLDRFVETIAKLRPALTYDPYTDLPLEENHLLHDGLPLEWVTATQLPDGRPVPVPYRLVNLDFTDPMGWRPRIFQETSNGLASGNTFVEAVLHALYEVVERDALARGPQPLDRCPRFDPRELDSDPVNELLDRFEAAEVAVDAHWVPSPTGMPCVLVRVVSGDYQIIAGGYGCHLKTEIATTRALTEAAQSRLTLISGARDDMVRRDYDPVSEMTQAPRLADRQHQCQPLPASLRASTSHESLLEDLVEVNRRCVAAYPAPPLILDLGQPEIGLSVARVIVPGARLNEGLA